MNRFTEKLDPNGLKARFFLTVPICKWWFFSKIDLNRSRINLKKKRCLKDRFLKNRFCLRGGYYELKNVRSGRSDFMNWFTKLLTACSLQTQMDAHRAKSARMYQYLALGLCMACHKKCVTNRRGQWHDWRISCFT